MDRFRGLPLRAISRTGFTSVRFGEWSEWTDSKGAIRVSTTHSIFLEAPWRLRRGDSFCNFGKGDEEGRADRDGPLWEAFFEALDADLLAFTGWELREAGELVVSFGEGFSIQVLPHNAEQSFHWAIDIEGVEEFLYCVGPDCVIEDWSSI